MSIILYLYTESFVIYGTNCPLPAVGVIVRENPDYRLSHYVEASYNLNGGGIRNYSSHGSTVSKKEANSPKIVLHIPHR